MFVPFFVVLFFLVSFTSAFSPCTNITSPIHLVIPNSNTTTNGNSNGLAGNAIIVFQDNGPGQNITNINITYAFCSSYNPLLSNNVVKFRFRSFINQTEFLDTSVPACDNIQTFCAHNTPQAGCLEGAMLLNSSWPMLSVVAAPQIWIVGQSEVTYGRFKANAIHTFADGPPAPNSTTTLV